MTSFRLLALVFTAVVGSFVIATVVSVRSSAEVDTLSASIVVDSMPSVVRLAALRGSIFEVELKLTRHLQVRRAKTRLDVERARTSLESEVQGYLGLRLLPGEARHWNEVQQTWARFDESVQRAVRLSDAGDHEGASDVVAESVEPSGARVITAALRTIEFNAEHGRRVAARIREVRDRAVLISYLLTGLSVLLGIAGAALIQRQARARRRAADAHARHLEARAEELEQFAGRVAHDLRSPLSAVQMAAGLLDDSASEDVPDLAERIRKAVRRADALIAGLLDFARSGAAPEPGARANPREIIRDLATGLHADLAAARIELLVPRVPPVLVSCSTGVYLSLVTNLLWNAIKYMGDARERRITVRVTERGSAIRTEVTDTGPGIASQDVPRLFEPHFRASSKGRDGLGLGLATVKKLVGSHHGSHGVSSSPGGSTFWFDLPRAGSYRDSVGEPAYD